jgi:hypothetical protein
MDWMTASVEIAGIAILCVWVVIPLREFAAIFRRILPGKVALEAQPILHGKRSVPASPSPLVESRP